jgi:MFS superfamily sulfate permease-like transporter
MLRKSYTLPGGIQTRDLFAGVAVFFIALPLCLGVAISCGTPPISGIIAGVVGGVVVGLISQSQTSISGPAAGLTVIVVTQMNALGSFQTFLLAVVLAGLLQILFGLLKLGFISGFFPNSVLRGLLTAIGVILVLKQIPHLLGHDADPESDMSFLQPDGENTFSELMRTAFDINVGATTVGLMCLAFLLLWDRAKRLSLSLMPATLVVIFLGIAIAELLGAIGGSWIIEPNHRVNIPTFGTLSGLVAQFQFPDWSAARRPDVYLAAITLAVTASLKTLLNVEAVDKLDPWKRNTPTNRELVAQGVGNVVCGLVGGLPVSSVIVRSSVNIHAGARTRVSTIVNGILLAVCVVLLPQFLNRIPYACVAAILIVTGIKLINFKQLKSLAQQEWAQVLPFLVTVFAIVLSDLLIGVLIGLATSIGFILASNLRSPLWRVVEKHIGGDVLHITLANQVSFLNRASLTKTFESIPDGTHVLLDARDTDYIDPDILDMIKEFEQERGPVHNIQVSLLGFRQHYEQVEDKILFADFTSRELRDTLTPAGVLQILKEGNERFLLGTRLSRDLNRQMAATADGQYPMAAVLGCIDSRAPTEMIFDVGLGDLLICRVAGNVAREKVIASLEYAAVVAGVKLLVVMGHTRCGAVISSVELAASGKTAYEKTGCNHLDVLVNEIQKVIDPDAAREAINRSPEAKIAYADEVARRNVKQMMKTICDRSECLRKRVENGSIEVVGCIYDVASGRVIFDIA